MVTVERHHGRPPGPVGLPFLGPIWDLKRKPLDFMIETHERYGDVAFTRFAGMPTYLVCHPDGIEHVLVTNRSNYSKGALSQRFATVLGQGLLLSRGELWTRQRKMMSPAFHHRRVASYAQQMVAATREHVDRWQDGEVRPTSTDMMRLTLDIAVRTLFGTSRPNAAERVGHALEVISEYFADTLSEPFPLPLSVPTPRNRRFDAARRDLFALVDQIIREKRRSSDHGDDLLSMLVELTDEDGRGMNDQQLRDEVLTLLLAGHETTALTLTYAYYLLGEHPEEDRLLGEEARSVLGDRDATLEDLPALTRTEQIVKESMRLYSPAAVLMRQPLADDEIMGWPIPKRAMVVLPQWVTHRDKRWFDRPNEFRPSRWTKEFEAGLPRFAYFPFGGGPRICIGSAFAMLEAKLVLATIAQRFRFEPVDRKPLELLASVTVRPKSTVWMRANKR